MDNSKSLLPEISARIAIIPAIFWAAGAALDREFLVPFKLTEASTAFGIGLGIAAVRRLLRSRDLVQVFDIGCAVAIGAGTIWATIGNRYFPLEQPIASLVIGITSGLIIGYTIPPVIRTVRRIFSSIETSVRHTGSDDRSDIDLLAQNFLTKLSDLTRGLWHGLQRRDKIFDPVKSYRDELELSLWSKRARTGAFIASGERTLTRLQTRLKNTIASKSLTLDREIAEANNRQLEANQQYDTFLQDKTPAFIKAHERLTEWWTALGRPPYTEEFKALSSEQTLRSFTEKYPKWTEKLDIPIDEQEHNTPSSPVSLKQPNKYFAFVRHLLGGASSAFLVLAVPVEVIFTYPAFLAVTDKFLLFDVKIVGTYISVSVAALLSSTLFTLALLKIGELIGVASLHVIDYKLTEKPAVNLRAALIFAFLSTVAIYTVTVASSLRSIAPAINAETLVLTEKNADAANSVNSSTFDDIATSPTVGAGRGSGGSIAPDNKEAETPGDAFREHRDKLLTQPLFFWNHTDGHVALVIYSILIITSAFQKRLSRDPVLPYDLIARQYVLELQIYVTQLNYSYFAKMQWASIKADLLTAKENLDAENHDADHELSSLTTAIELQTSTMDKTREQQSSWENAIALYLDVRTRRFASYYRWFRFDLKTTTEMLRAHFAGS